MAGFTVTTSNITDTTVTVSVAASMPLPEEEGNIVITVTASGTQVATQSVTPSGAQGVAVSANFTGLTANTGYTATFTSDAGDGTTAFTTKSAGYNSPKTATQGQWENLATRVKAKPNITMTDVDPGEGAPLGQNEFVAVYGGTPILMDYRTNEIDTGAKWIDDTPIYKKTIFFGALPNATKKAVAHNISNLGLVIKTEAITKQRATGDFLPIPFPSALSGANGNMDLKIDATSVAIATNMDRTDFIETYVTIYYTKSL